MALQPAQMSGLLRAELSERYRHLCRTHGARNTVPPTPDLVEAFTELMRSTWTGGSTAAVRACIRDAGDVYEYVVGRWGSPRWRALLAVAFDVGVLNKRLVLDDEPGAERRHRSAGYYSRDVLLGAAGRASGSA